MNLILLIISTALIFGIPGVLGNDSALKSCDLVIDDDKRSSHFRFPSAVHLGGFNMEFSLCGQTSCGPGVLVRDNFKWRGVSSFLRLILHLPSCATKAHRCCPQVPPHSRGSVLTILMPLKLTGAHKSFTRQEF